MSTEEVPAPVYGPRIDRLRVLLAHMEAAPEVRGNRRFDFGQFRSECGTAGCMAGELPAIWPEEWELVPHELTQGWLPRMKGEPARAFDIQAEQFFGISIERVFELFFPAPGLCRRLRNSATREEAVENLRRVIGELEERERAAAPARAEFREVCAELRRGR